MKRLAGLIAILLLGGAAATVSAQGDTLRLGAATVSLKPRGIDPAVPKAPHRTPEMLKRAAPSNQWYSTLVYADVPEPIYAQPLSVRPTAAGLEVALPRKEVVPTERRDVEIQYSHRNPLVISPTAFAPARGLLAGASDWAIDMAMAPQGESFEATVAHGSPYVWVRVGRGDLRVRLNAAGERFGADTDARVLQLRVGGVPYALYGPTGVRWEQVSPTEWLARLPAGKGYLTVGALPDESPATQALLQRHAWSALVNTRVDWSVDRTGGAVVTRFNATTRALEGADAGALQALYPHHWHGNASVAGRLGPAYDTVRGPLKLLASSQFETRTTYTGFVPYWPRVEGVPQLDQLNDVMRTDLRNARRMMLEIGQGPYWQGKGLQRLVKMLDVVEQQGDAEGAKRLLDLLRKRVEEWFSGEDRKRYFHWDQTQGTVVAYPEEYFSVVQMNDHHFHYGYWIRAIAEIALRDREWASRERWGAMVDLLIKDIAHTERGSAQFPFLRNFDPYEGHSWASGIGLGAHGNNQESSSEALNAWTGLILWGEINNDPALRDLGIWLLATETESVKHYWFDLHRIVFAPEYKNVDVSMVFGAKYAHNTWWIDDPRQITGINLLPMTTVSTYFATHPDYIRRNLEALKDEQKIWADRGKKVDPPDIWQDVFAKYLALADPAAALQSWNRWGAVEFGDSRTHTLHFLLSLGSLGAPDTSVQANTTLYQVFRRPDGRRTYLAFNAGKAPITVRFTDGQQLEVAPGQLARASRP